MATFQTPTEAQVREALRRIPTIQLRRAFFEGLKNPLWVAPLAKEGAFGNPPEPEATDDGLIRDVYWPEINYLTRVAPDAPAAVVDVLLKLQKSNNAWVRRGVFTVGAAIPADQAARLQPLIKAWISSGFGWRTDPREIVSLAVNLLQGGQYEVGKWFANLLFKPGKASSNRKPRLVLQEHWYEEGLPRVVAVLSDDGLSVVLPWLVAYERSKGYLKRGSDITFVSRDSIRSRSDSHESVEQTLIDAVRDLAVKAMLLDPKETKSSLLATNMILARKIGLFALAEAIKRNIDDDEKMKAMLKVADELLYDSSFLDNSCRIEYAELARSVTSHTTQTLERLSEFIEAGLRVDDESLRQRLGGENTDSSAIDDQVKDYNDRRVHRWLSAIGIDALPEQLRTRLAELDEHWGVIESPLEPEKQFTMMWGGPNSPVTQDEMLVMSPAELVAHLESWHDTGNGWGPEPSHEGQGRQLTALLTTNPKALSSIDDLPNRLRPTYVRAILHGWEAAFKADLELDWEQTADLIRGVLTHDDESIFPVEGGQFDDDANVRPAKQAAVGLLEDLAKERDAFTIPDKVMSQFAQMLVVLADDEKAWSDYISHDESGMDPLTVSLNWQWPMRVRGLIYLMARGTETGWYEAARSALEREFARDDTRGASRAVLGEGLGRLLLTDPEWLEPNIPIWFGDEHGIAAVQQIALTTAIAVHYYHPKLYELLASPMLAVVKSGDSIVSGWRTQFDPLQRIGEWIINGIIRGHQTLEDPLPHEFFASAPAKVRGEAISRIAWSFMHTETVDESIRDRFAELWDMRVEHVRSHADDREELDGFEWFVKNKKFDVEWWLPRLKEAAELDPHLGSKTSMIGQEIASSAEIDPRVALDVVKLLLKDRNDADIAGFNLRRDAVPIVLARAIASGDGELMHEAELYMNQLGERGDLGLETAVSQALYRIIAQDNTDN
jgi:hypothetical protein